MKELKKEESIERISNEINFEDLEEMLRECNSYNGYFEDLDYQVFDEDFFEIYFKDKIEVARACIFGNVNWNDDYIHLNAYGNLESVNEFEYKKKIEEYKEEIIEEFIELYLNNNVNLYNSNITDLINEYNEEEE